MYARARVCVYAHVRARVLNDFIYLYIISYKIDNFGFLYLIWGYPRSLCLSEQALFSLCSYPSSNPFSDPLFISSFLPDCPPTTL